MIPVNQKLVLVLKTLNFLKFQMIWADFIYHFNDTPLAPPALLGMMEARFVRFRNRRYG